MTTIGDLIRDHREAVHLSQSKLAMRAGFDHSYVSRIESGAREPSRDAVLFLAEGMSLDPAQTDELLAAGGFMPLDPTYLLAAEPELGAVLAVLRSPATTDVRRVGIRAMLGALADLGAGDSTVRAAETRSEAPGRDEQGGGAVLTHVTLDPLAAAITAPSDRRAA